MNPCCAIYRIYVIFVVVFSIVDFLVDNDVKVIHFLHLSLHTISLFVNPSGGGVCPSMIRLCARSTCSCSVYSFLLYYLFYITASHFFSLSSDFSVSSFWLRSIKSYSTYFVLSSLCLILSLFYFSFHISANPLHSSPL